jgi:hypothetical protein
MTGAMFFRLQVAGWNIICDHFVLTMMADPTMRPDIGNQAQPHRVTTFSKLPF